MLVASPLRYRQPSVTESVVLPPDLGARYGRISPSAINISFAPRTAPLSEMRPSSDVAFKIRNRPVRVRPAYLRMPEMRSRSDADCLKRSDGIHRERFAFR